MPFELGVFFAAKHYGLGQQKRKTALVLDTHPSQYRSSLSDISGQDIEVHKGVPRTAICKIRDWLNAYSSAAGGDFINKQYCAFSRQLPAAAEKQRLRARELTYVDICRAIESWLKDND
jgi:hypothetical protein